jgi:hypothetical protein
VIILVEKMKNLMYVITGIVALAALIAMSTEQNAKADWSNSNGWCGYDKNGNWKHDYSCGDLTIKKAKKVYVDNSVQRTCEAFCWFWNWNWDSHDDYSHNTYNSYGKKKHHD